MELIEGLKRAYGGRLPSIAAIARDFALKAPHLSHVSTETIRKWIRGESLPHISRMQVLIDWLGNDIALPFDKPVMALQLAQRNLTTNGHTNGNGYNHQIASACHPIHDQLVKVIDQLNEKECQSILAIAQLLADKNHD